eukprot:gene21757-28780_t
MHRLLNTIHRGSMRSASMLCRHQPTRIHDAYSPALLGDNMFTNRTALVPPPRRSSRAHLGEQRLGDVGQEAMAMDSLLMLSLWSAQIPGRAKPTLVRGGTYAQ